MVNSNISSYQSYPPAVYLESLGLLVSTRKAESSSHSPSSRDESNYSRWAEKPVAA